MRPPIMEALGIAKEYLSCVRQCPTEPEAVAGMTLWLIEKAFAASCLVWERKYKSLANMNLSPSNMTVQPEKHRTAKASAGVMKRRA